MAGSNSGTAGNGNANSENNPHRMQELLPCPKCNIANLSLKQKKNQTGYFIGCLNFPDCKNAIWLPDECKEYTVLEESCARCGPQTKLLKFKFQTAFHKANFDATQGWYKTCLICDAKFRNEFNINLDSVKRVGGIVAQSNVPATASSRNNAGTAAGSTTAAIFNNRGTNQAPTAGSAAGAAKQPKKRSNSETRKKPAAAASKTKTSGSKTLAKTAPIASTTIRNFFSSSSSTIAAAAAAANTAQLAAAELQDIPMEEFFDSNDGFDDIMLQAEANLPRTAAASNVQQNRAVNTLNAALSDDIAAAFAADDNDNDDFANFQWGTGGGGGGGIGTATTNNNIFEESFSRFIDNIEDNSRAGGSNDLVWGTAARNALNSSQHATNSTQSPPHKRSRTEAASHSSPWRPLSEAVRCTGCHQVAKE